MLLANDFIVADPNHETGSQNRVQAVENNVYTDQVESSQSPLKLSSKRHSSLDMSNIYVDAYESDTFAMNVRLIEGYLCKEIDKKGVFRRTRRHLRYFRIIFATGKLNVKECRAQNEMRSFLLKDILHVHSQDSSQPADFGSKLEPNTPAGTQRRIESIDKVKQLYRVNETGAISDNRNWPFTFTVELSQRSMTLSARTARERSEWLRALNLIVRM